MIEIESYDDVHRINMSISFFGKQIFPINAYIVNDLLIDTGAANLSKDFLDIIKEFTINTVVNTHAHPDHIGSNHAFPFVYIHPKGVYQLKNPQLEMRLKCCIRQDIPRITFHCMNLRRSGHSPGTSCYGVPPEKYLSM
ncbi:MAG: MBL fold metallo-hydrolase [Theionarchaea archaeon]|nr:MBL fold metallo-hydrolase [Theionarchaea archaeon]